MKHKVLLKFMCIVMALCVLNSQAMEVNAATYGTKASSGSYTYVGREGKGIYSHEISKNSLTWRLWYPQKTVTTTIYHVYGHGDDDLTYENRVTLSTTKTTEWSVNASIAANASVDILGLFEAGVSATVGMGYGNSYAYGVTYTVASSVAKTIKDTAPTGYYTRVPGYTFYKMRDVVTRMDRAVSDSFYFDIPYGGPVLYTIYSENNSKWVVY